MKHTEGKREDIRLVTSDVTLQVGKVDKIKLKNQIENQ